MAEKMGTSDPPVTITPHLAAQVQEKLGQNVYLCYQCVKCTSGCPVAEFFDWQPHQVMRALQLGQEDIALHSQTPWLCASCQTCSTRCPQDLDIPAIMDYLTRQATAKGVKAPIQSVKVFNEAFMREVGLWGRSYELGLLAEIKMRTGDLTSDLDLGARMILKNKFPFLPHPSYALRKTTPVAQTDQTVAYYPGCAAHSTSPEIDISVRAVCEALGLKLVEPRGWVCCGSSAAHRIDPEAALRLPMRNLALVEQTGLKEVTMPCAACFNRHKAALYEIRRHPERKSRADERLNYEYNDTVQVNTLIETILLHVDKQKIASQVKKPLDGLRVVCYYGCLLTRPPQVTGAPHPENPTFMDELVRLLGAEVLDWSYKTACCGAAHSLTRPDIVLKLSSNLIQQARKVGADIITVACPLCHTNLDARQFQMELPQPTPILYFTQLMALAFGLSKKAAALHKNLVDPQRVPQIRKVCESL